MENRMYWAELAKSCAAFGKVVKHYAKEAYLPQRSRECGDT